MHCVYLRKVTRLENYIDALSAHILKIQEEELEVTKQFSEALKLSSGQLKGKHCILARVKMLKNLCRTICSQKIRK